MDWQAIRDQVLTVLKDARTYQPGWTMKAGLRGLTSDEASADAIVDLVRRELSKDNDAQPDHVRDHPPGR
jgi:hypothetical protein